MLKNYLLSSLVDSRRKKLIAILILVLILLFSISSLIFPLLTKNIVNSFQRNELKFSYFIFLVIFLIIKSFIESFYQYCISKYGSLIIKDLRIYIYSEILEYKTEFFDYNNSTVISSRIINDTLILKELLSIHIPKVFSGLILLIGTMLLTLYLDWKLTLFITLLLPSAFIIVLPLANKIGYQSEIQQLEKSKFIAKTQEAFKNIKLIKASNAEQTEKNMMRNHVIRLYSSDLAEAKFISIISPLINLILLVTLTLIIGYGLYRINSGSLEISTLIAFILYIFQLIQPISTLGNFFGEYKKAQGALKELDKYLNIINKETSGNKRYSFIKTLKFEDVTLKFDNLRILNRLSFTIEKGSHVTLIGPSGAGKSSLLNLLSKIYSPTDGEILLDQVSYNSINNSSLRSNIGYVSQTTPIIEGTFRENLLYGLDDIIISPSTINNVLKEVNLYDYIYSLPDKLNTYIEEDGKTLSGGQKQRINIARLLLKDPDIILLDEPTSSLDNESKKIVNRALELFLKNKTVIKVSHSTNEINDNDQIIFVENGTVVYQGIHKYLLEKERYLNFVNSH